MSRKKDSNLPISAEDESQIQLVFAHYHQIADDLHTSTSRQQADAALATLYGLPEEAQMALLKLLVKEQQTDAADVLLAIDELSPHKAIRKEAHRGLIQLTASKTYPSWTPKDETPIVTATPHPPRFWKGSVTRMREQGEIQLILCFEQGYEFGEARMLSFLLDFWEAGVKDFHIEVGTKRTIDARANDLNALYAKYVGEERFHLTDCTLAEGRRLLEEALSVNQWHSTRPHEDYRHHLPTVQQLMLNAPATDLDRSFAFINPNLEPDEVVAHFIGSWSMGDYGLCYDLLAPDSLIRDDQARNEWVTLRRKWADEAHPARLQIGFIREGEHNQQSFWLPSAILSNKATAQREIEVAWSLELSDTQLSGTLLEMAMGTTVNKETGRHWFWSKYTLAQEEDAWRIQRMSDEGADAQGLPIADLQNRLKEQDERIQEITKQHAPDSPGAREGLDEIIRRMIQAMHYNDALIAKLPLDRTLYEDAYSRAMGINMMERAIAYLERLAQRFTNDRSATLRQLGAAQTALSDAFRRQEREERSEHYLAMAEASLRESLALDDNVIGHMLLGELLMHKELLDEAKAHIEQARSMNPALVEAAQIEIDLGTIARAKKQFDLALSHYQHALALQPNDPTVLFNIGQVYRFQQNYAEAEINFQRVIELQPNELRAYNELTNVYLSTGRVAKARETLEQSLRINPNSASLRAMLSTVLLEEGDRRRAETLLEEAEHIDPTLDVVQMARQMLNEHKAKKR